MSAKEAKNAFGLLMDMARAEPVVIAKHGRPVVVVLSIEQFELLKGRRAARSREMSTSKKQQT
jgi:prevent-host-death family protein